MTQTNENLLAELNAMLKNSPTPHNKDMSDEDFLKLMEKELEESSKEGPINSFEAIKKNTRETKALMNSLPNSQITSIRKDASGKVWANVCAVGGACVTVAVSMAVAAKLAGLFGGRRRTTRNSRASRKKRSTRKNK
jgi:hypothetical protein